MGALSCLEVHAQTPGFESLRSPVVIHLMRQLRGSFTLPNFRPPVDLNSSVALDRAAV
jgi:hypothetical protein